MHQIGTESHSVCRSHQIRGGKIIMLLCSLLTCASLFFIILKSWDITICNRLTCSSSMHTWLTDGSIVLFLTIVDALLFCTVSVYLISFLFIQCGLFMAILPAKGDYLMETSYLKAHPFGGHYPQWMPNLPSDRDKNSNPCAWESQGPQSTCGFTVPWQPQSYLIYLFSFIYLFEKWGMDI